jgi:hypothetical protein
MISTVQVHDRAYKEWNLEPHICVSPTAYHPLTHKCFHGDVIRLIPTHNDSVQIQLIESHVQTCGNIPGILMLENNRTYGRTDNKKRLYYKCRPYDSHYPDFLIPYTIPVGFQKNFQNKYVTFKFEKWTTSDKHPYGILSQVVGDVHHLPSFYEYQLYCNNLHTPISPAINLCKKRMREHSIDEWMSKIEQNPCRYGPIYTDTVSRSDIFTVDPPGCTDRDDALSIRHHPLDMENDPNNIQYVITVYIANVWTWLEAFDMWDTIGTRASTVYLPDTKRSMLPTILAEQLCSLDVNKERYAFAMDFTVNQIGDHIQIKEYNHVYQCKIKVARNYDYEDPKLLKQLNYRRLLFITSQLDNTISDSHDVVAFWMTRMNMYLAKLMFERDFGIFRSVKTIGAPSAPPPSITNCPTPQCSVQDSMSTISDTIASQTTISSISSTSTHSQTNLPHNFLQLWEQKLQGTYVAYNPFIHTSNPDELRHTVMNTNLYIHATSPIRRLVDLLNQTLWVINVFQPTHIREKPIGFVQGHIAQMQQLNQQMKNIKKVQSNCDILYKITEEPLWSKQILYAVVLHHESTYEPHKYTVYVDELKWISTVFCTDRELEPYEKIRVKLYVFEREDQMRKKVRLQIIS